MNPDKKKPLFFHLRLAAFICGLINFPAPAAVTLPAFFSDGMVLQRDRPAAVWGRATAGSTLTVSLGDQSVRTMADAAGRWWTQLPARPADDQPRELSITGDGPAVVVRDVVVGDVWFCAGESNLAFPLDRADGGDEAIATSADPLLREFTVNADGSATPQDDVAGRWQKSSPDTTGQFSAIGYFFAQRLRRDVGVPVGIVRVSAGDSTIEAWSRRGSLDGVGLMKPRLKQLDARQKAATRPADDLARNTTPGWLFNGAVAPLVGLGVRGFVWHQGESNVDTAEAYRTLFPRLINDWRKQWGLDGPAAVPFLFVQLAARDSDDPEPFGSPTADLRLAQTAGLDPRLTGMAVAIDNRAADWQPSDKKIVADRLANLALKLAYGRDVPTAGPIWIGRRFEGDTAIVRFHSTGGLFAPDDLPTGFTIAGEDRRFVPADAIIVGKDRETIELRAAGVDRPVAVRYGWSRGPACDLTNKAGLPAAPFRTDDWPTPTTKPAKGG